MKSLEKGTIKTIKAASNLPDGLVTAIKLIENSIKAKSDYIEIHI